MRDCKGCQSMKLSMAYSKMTNVSLNAVGLQRMLDYGGSTEILVHIGVL